MTYFSDAAGINQPETGLMREDVPYRVRVALSLLVDELPPSEEDAVISFIRRERDLTPNELPSRKWDDADYRPLADYLNRARWYAVLDACSALFYYYISEGDEDEAQRFRTRLNGSLLRWYSAYSMREDGRIAEPGAVPAEAAVQEARALLQSSDFAGPDRQFQEAIDAFQRRPDPNYETVVSSAWNAIEGVARILVGDPSIALGDAIKRIADEKNLHGALRSSISSLYGYASDAGGRHGLTGAPNADGPIAEFCLHQAAAAIVLMARLYGHDIVTGSHDPPSAS